MKKTVALLILAFSGFFVYSQVRPINEMFDVPRVQHKKADEFNPVDFVEFGIPKKAVPFLMGEGSQSDPVVRGIRFFKMNRYETTYYLWYKVRVWAEKNGYTFANPGQEGSGGLRGKPPTSLKCNQPVTNVNWYDCIVWCNAFSEMSGLVPCYTCEEEILRDSTDTVACDLSECNFSASGYRLPTETEWEYAARKTSAKKLQSGSLASGQVNQNGEEDENVAPGEVAWFYENSDSTMQVGTAGCIFDPSAPPASGSGNPNGAGLFDMSGNVLEWCWDWNASYTSSADVPAGKRYSGPKYGNERIMRGGSWNQYTLFISAGDRYAFDPNEFYNYFGFRLVTR